MTCRTLSKIAQLEQTHQGNSGATPQEMGPYAWPEETLATQKEWSQVAAHRARSHVREMHPQVFVRDAYSANLPVAKAAIVELWNDTTKRWGSRARNIVSDTERYMEEQHTTVGQDCKRNFENNMGKRDTFARLPGQRLDADGLSSQVLGARQQGGIDAVVSTARAESHTSIGPPPPTMRLHRETHTSGALSARTPRAGNRSSDGGRAVTSRAKTGGAGEGVTLHPEIIRWVEQHGLPHHMYDTLANNHLTSLQDLAELTDKDLLQLANSSIGLVVKLRRAVKGLQSKSVERRKHYPVSENPLFDAQENRFVNGRKQWRTWFVQPEIGKPVIVL